MKINIKTICTAVILALSISVQADNASAEKIAETVKKSVSAQPKKVIEIVSSQVAQNDSSACEIVKAAIVASNADKDLVAEIVQAATEAAPDKIRIIGQCAVAVAPDAIAEVQTVITKFAAAGGGGAYVLAAPPVAPVNTAPVNPLDFPGQGAVGPTPGGPGGFPLFPPGLQPPTVSTTINGSDAELTPRRPQFVLVLLNTKQTSFTQNTTQYEKIATNSTTYSCRRRHGQRTGSL